MDYPSDRSSYAASPPQTTLVSVVRERLRLKHYSLRTEQSCVGWIRRFIRVHGRRHPRELDAAEVETFVSHARRTRPWAFQARIRALPIPHQPRDRRSMADSPHVVNVTAADFDRVVVQGSRERPVLVDF